MAESSFECYRQVMPAPSSPTFCYPPARHAYVVYLNRVRAARRRRPFWSTKLFWGSLCIFSFAVLLTGSLWLLIGFYTTENVDMGRNYSRVYTAHTLFVRRIVVTNRLQNEGPIVYGLSETPKLDKEINWTNALDAIVPPEDHQEWNFWLNRGSQVAVKFNISDPSLELLLVIIQGEGNLQKWAQDLSVTDSVSSWKIAQGMGSLQYEVKTDQRYYFAFGNTQSVSVQVNVKLTLQSKVHNTDKYKSQCHLASTACAVHLNYLGSDVLLLTAPQTDQGIDHVKAFDNVRSLQQDDNIWSVSVAYEQRWLTYLVFWGAMAVVMLILLVFCRPTAQDVETPQENRDTVSAEAAAPLVVFEEEGDKLVKAEQSGASSVFPADYDLEGTEDLEDFMCIICFDQQRSCFFDPCGHCATCYSCSMKILKEKKASCPLCRQPIRLVRKLFLH